MLLDAMKPVNWSGISANTSRAKENEAACDVNWRSGTN
jgi:hypothetical protein